MSGPPDPFDNQGPVGGDQPFPAVPPPYGYPNPQLPGPTTNPPPGQQWNQFPPGQQQGQIPGGQLPELSSGRPGPVRLDAGIGSALAAAGAWFFWSLCVVAWLGGFFGASVGWAVVGVWVLSGGLTFIRPVEEMIARHLLRLRLPTSIERQRLGPGWYQLAHRAGVDPDRFTIWIQESEDVNATPTPGHTIAVTRWALYTVPVQHLEAVLAHELGHHLGGRAWFSLLSFWYSIPARVTLIGVRALGRLMRRIPALGCGIVLFLVIGYTGVLAAVLIFGNGYLWPFLFLTPFIAPPILAWVSRAQVKQADRKAARLGYGPSLVQVLHGWQIQHQNTLGQRGSRRAEFMSGRPSLVDRVHVLEATPAS
jgi:Zn-dependent protease with chaperone function